MFLQETDIMDNFMMTITCAHDSCTYALQNKQANTMHTCSLYCISKFILKSRRK